MEKVKILLVDDSTMMLRHVAKLLSEKDWQIWTAASMPAALDAFYKRTPHAVLADFILEGGHTGLGTIEAIFAVCQPDGPKKPAAAIYTQGALSANDQKKAAAMGVPIIQKPSYGKEQDFIMSVALWLSNAKVL